MFFEDGNPDFVSTTMSDGYNLVTVEVVTREHGAPNKKGRPANTSWITVAAKACQLIHDDGYPNTQAEFLKILESELDSLDILPAYGTESLTKLVSAIYKFRTR